MIYIMEEKLLICSYWDSTIRIYDESESEESSLLKVLCGGHDDSEILVMAYSQKLSLLASGSRNGWIALWDVETGRMEWLFQADPCEITALEFSENYPILVSTSDNGSLNLWGVSKKCP